MTRRGPGPERDAGHRVLVLGPVLLPGPDGEAVAPRGERSVLLVAALALAEGAGVAAGSLIRDLWPEGGPRDPRAALQSLVSRLRAETVEGVVVSRDGGYALAVDTDLAWAARLLGSGRRLLNDARPTRAVADARGALDLWRGDPDPRLHPDAPVSLALGSRADRLHEDLTRLLWEASAQDGDHETVVELASGALRLDPTDEDAALALMSAYAALDRSADGLRAYSRLRHVLAVELGTDPGPDLVRLGDRLRAVAALDDGTPPGGATPAGDPTPRRDRSGRTRLGVRPGPSPLIGRDEDIAGVEAALDDARLLTVLGTGGLGKTRLVHEIAARSEAPFVAVVELAGIRTDDVVVALADGLGIASTGMGRLADRVAASRSQVLDQVRHRDGVLVLDNCEHVVDGVARWVVDLLAAAPRLRVLTTSRAPLLVPGERVHVLPPLPSAGGGPAVRLFEQRARAARPGVALPREAVARLCDRLDGLPLAIELAAARTRTMSVEEIEHHLDERFVLLRAGDRLAPDRHRTLEAVIEWSWNLLGAFEQRVLARLAVLPDGVSPQAAVEIAPLDDEGVGRWDVLDAIDALATQSLVSVTEVDGRTRYRMLETVREYGILRLDDLGESDRVREAVLVWARGFAIESQRAQLGPGQVAAMARLRGDQENLLFALREAIRARRPDVVVEVFGALAGVWALLGAEERILGLVEPVMSLFPGWRVPTESLDAAVLTLVAVGATSAFTGGPHRTRVLARLRRLMRRDGIGARARAFGATLLASPDAMPAHTAALRTSEDRYVAVLGSLLSAQTAENAGRLAEAYRWGVEAYERAGSSGFVAEQALAAVLLAACASELGDTVAVARWVGPAREGLDLIGAEGSLRHLELLELSTAVVVGDLERAEVLCSRLETLDDGTPENRELRLLARANRAEMAYLRGDVPGALAMYEEVSTAFAREGAAGFVAPGSAPAQEGVLSPWSLIVTAGWLVRLVLADDPERGARAAGELRARLVDGYERHPDLVDYPVVGAVLHALGAQLALGEDRVEEGARLIAWAERMGARQDIRPLRRGPVLEAFRSRYGPAPLEGARVVVAAQADTGVVADLLAGPAVPSRHGGRDG